jgi:two-component sensor histidine kinase
MFHGAQVGTLDFGTYLHELCRRLESTLADAQSGAVRIHVEAEAGPVDLDRAVPLGLIVNELVSNATKHGFADNRQGSVEVRFHRIDSVYRLRVWDEGPGGAMSGTAILQQGLGQQLIEGLVRRIKGCLVIGDGPGFEATVDFPADLHAGNVASSQP